MTQEPEPTREENLIGSVAPLDPTNGGAIAVQVECPFCAEMVSAKARKCRYCGETIDVAMRKAEEALRASERAPNVYMNAGGGGAAAAASGGGQQLRPFNHLLHIILSVITIGWWLPVYLLVYLFRNKSKYF